MARICHSLWPLNGMPLMQYTSTHPYVRPWHGYKTCTLEVGSIHNIELTSFTATLFCCQIPIENPLFCVLRFTCHYFNMKQGFTWKQTTYLLGVRAVFSKKKCNSCFQRAPQRETALYKVTSDLLIADYPWHCSDIILYTSASGAKRERGRDDISVCVWFVCVSVLSGAAQQQSWFSSCGENTDRNVGTSAAPPQLRRGEEEEETEWSQGQDPPILTGALLAKIMQQLSSR